MTIKYKDTTIKTIGISVLVDYIEPDPYAKESDKKRFFFNYSIHKETITIKEIHFRGGMVIAPPRMKETMEDIKAKFAIFKDNGSGTIEEFLSFMVSQERNEKIEKLGI
jgi:hypothetical protein